MKKIILSAIAVVGAFAMTSCSDFLDPQTEGAYTTNSYFNNDQQCVDALDAVYARIAQENMFGREIFWEQGATTDVVWGRTRSYPTLATMSYTGDESPLRGFWEQCYKFGARANWVVSSLINKGEENLSEVGKRSLGEAYFLRAFYHFYIAYRYGTDELGVPFVKYEDYGTDYDFSIPPQQATVMDNYKMIIEDLQKAEQLLPDCRNIDAANFGRASKQAAVGYMAKVYAYWACWDKSQWANVITCVDKLESQYGRALVANYNDLFSDDFSKWNNSEYIFAMPSNGGANGGGCEFPGVVLENKGWGVFNGWGQNKPSYDIFEQFMADDANLIDANKGNIRKVRSVLEYGQEFMFNGETRQFFSESDVEAGFMINKYMDPFGHADFCASDEKGMGYVNTSGDWPTARLNVPILRFADLLLLRAEAKIVNGQDGAADINKVRNRANVKSLDHPATMKDIYHERRVELAFEFYDHLYDLKRWHKSGDAEIKALAAAELNARPRVRVYEDRSNPDANFVIAPYNDYTDKGSNAYVDGKITFPFPSEQVAKSNGALKQNSFWK